MWCCALVLDGKHCLSYSLNNKSFEISLYGRGSDVCFHEIRDFFFNFIYSGVRYLIFFIRYSPVKISDRLVG